MKFVRDRKIFVCIIKAEGCKERVRSETERLLASKWPSSSPLEFRLLKLAEILVEFRPLNLANKSAEIWSLSLAGIFSGNLVVKFGGHFGGILAVQFWRNFGR